MLHVCFQFQFVENLFISCPSTLSVENLWYFNFYINMKESFRVLRCQPSY